jgi:c-di-GMP-binding flagellar brake protein YcgR
MPRKLNEIEIDVLRTVSELNENITILIPDKNPPVVYHSRFLGVDFAGSTVVIDEASPESSNALPLSKGEDLNVFFQFKGFRYIFFSRVLEHTIFSLNNRGVYALKISLPDSLRDGERREYFRVETPKSPLVTVRFLLHKAGADYPVMVAGTENVPQDFSGKMVDISGGGFCLAVDEKLDVVRGDYLHAFFQLKGVAEEIEVWTEVRYRKKYVEKESLLGLMYLPEFKNYRFKGLKNRIMKFIIERQRELLFK